MNRWAPRVAGPICMGRIMSTKVIETKCPGCGAMVRLDERQKQAFCNYCGSPVTVEDTREFVTRNIDEADLKRAETEQLIRLKELEMQERETKKTERRRRRKAILTVLLVLIMLASYAICEASPSSSSLYESSGMASLVCMTAAMLIWVSEIDRK